MYKQRSKAASSPTTAPEQLIRHIAARRLPVSSLKSVCILTAALAAGTAQAAFIVVNSTADPGVADDSICTLREAIGAINNQADDADDCAAGISGPYGTNDTVGLTFVSGDIQLAAPEGEIAITKPVILIGPGAANLSIHGNNGARHATTPISRIFNISVGPTTISGLTLTKGKVAGAGGAVFAVGDLTLKDSVVTSNATLGNNSPGGGLFISGNAILTGSTVSGNSTSGDNSDGGGLTVAGPSATLTNSTVSDNSTTGDDSTGGGLLVVNNATLTNSTVSGNSTSGDNSDGGGLYASGTATLTNSTVSSNSTAGNYSGGGGLYAGGTAMLTNSTVSDNSTAGDHGNSGGLYVSSDATLTHSSVSSNSTAGIYSAGGGLIVSGNATLTGSTVSANFTTGDNSPVGGLAVAGNATLMGSTVSGNSTAGDFTFAGGLAVAGDAGLTNSTVSGNSTKGNTSPYTGSSVVGGGTYYGGGGLVTNGNLFLINSTIAGNSAQFGADGVVLITSVGDTADNFAAGNSIIAQSGVGEQACSTPIVAGNHNLVANTTGSDVSCGVAPFATQTTLTALNLQPLAGNGGPTQTHALGTGSGAIDTGDNVVCAMAAPPGPNNLDQRGIVRPQDGDNDATATCDIGSFEKLPAGNGFDLGDAPDSSTLPVFPTLLANNGAAHVATGPTLGATRDTEADGQPSLNADGDGSDEDGVTLPAVLTAGATANIDVTASAAAVLNAWVDFNNDGDWNDAGEQVFTDQVLAAGSNPLSFAVPAGADTNFNFARFRLTAPGQTGVGPTGVAQSGEVEDYRMGSQATSGSGGGGGCTVAANGHSGIGWLALLLSSGLLWRWRQRRNRSELP